MPAFNLEHERSRLQEDGLTRDARIHSAQDSLRTLVAERTGAPSYFRYRGTRESITSVGYEQRGDIDKSFELSVLEAANERIAQRYALENRGFGAVKGNFFDVPLYSTFMLFSPPPDEPIPGYPGHTPIYFYYVTLGRDEDEREIKALSCNTWFSKEEQAELLNDLHPKTPILPTEESILTSPVNLAVGGTGTESFQTLWNKVRNFALERGYGASNFPQASVMEAYLLHGEKIMQNEHPELTIMAHDLATRLADGATQTEIEDDFEIMLKRGDKDLLYKDWGHLPNVQMSIPERRISIDARLLFLANKDSEAVRTVMTYCGISGGMSSNSREAAVNAWSFTAKRKEVTSEKRILCCTCPFCGQKVEAVIENGLIICPNEECEKGKKGVPYSQ